MSNYQVEPASQPQALSTGGRSSRSATSRSRGSRGARSCAARSARAVRLWLTEVTGRLARLPLAEPESRLRSADQDRARSRT